MVIHQVAHRLGQAHGFHRRFGILTVFGHAPAIEQQQSQPD